VEVIVSMEGKNNFIRLIITILLRVDKIRQKQKFSQWLA